VRPVFPPLLSLGSRPQRVLERYEGRMCGGADDFLAGEEGSGDEGIGADPKSGYSYDDLAAAMAEDGLEASDEDMPGGASLAEYVWLTGQRGIKRARGRMEGIFCISEVHIGSVVAFGKILFESVQNMLFICCTVTAPPLQLGCQA
jgi:hypothetical protein